MHCKPLFLHAVLSINPIKIIQNLLLKVHHLILLVGQESITPQLLQLIKWSDSYGQMRDLRLYDELSIVWTDVADLIGLDFQTSDQIKALHQGNPRNCVKDVIKKWKMDETALNSHYSCTWNGLCFLLEDTKLSTASKNLKEALAADVSSFQGNLNSGMLK